MVNDQIPERNAPCPCGSGKKFKKCCIDRFDPNRRPKVEEVEEERRDLHVSPAVEEHEDSEENPWDFMDSRPIATSAKVVSTPELEKDGDTLEKELSATSTRREEAEAIRRFLTGHERIATSVQEMICEYAANIVDERKEPLPTDELLRFMDFLRLRHPDIFWKCAYGGFQRCYLLAEEAGEQGIIGEWIEALAAEPDREPDVTYPLIDLFLATGRRKHLTVLLPRVVPILRSSSNVFNSDSIFSPFSSMVIDDLLSQPRETRDTSATLRRWYQAIDYPLPDHLETEVQETLSGIEGPFRHFDFGISQSLSQAHESLEKQSFSFMRHLHEAVGMEWFTADAWRIWGSDYLLDKLGEKKARKDLHVTDPQGLLKYLNRKCGDLFGPYLPKWFGTLNAVFHLAGYLHRCGAWPAATMEAWQSMCRTIFEKNYPSIDSHSSYASAFKKFPLF